MAGLRPADDRDGHMPIGRAVMVAGVYRFVYRRHPAKGLAPADE
jgi:hypothetical protein